MQPRLLLDTHIVVRWLAEPKKLSRQQQGALALSVNRREPLAVSAITLLEIALFEARKGGLESKAEQLLASLEMAPEFVVLPLTFEIATELASLGPFLRDPGDRTIVATARVHGLKLLSSDQRIIESKLVPTLD